MSRLLVPLGSCSEAFELAPVVRACRDDGWLVDCAWFGDEAGQKHARELGLPAIVRHVAPPPELAPAQRYAAAAAFAAGLLEPASPTAVLTCGHGTMALAAGTVFHHEGVPVVRANAGQRSHAATRDERRRRAADQAASHWCVGTGSQRLELLREGLPEARIHVVGSLLPAALAALPAQPPVARFVWLALEHGAALAEAEALAALLGNLADIARRHGLPVHAAAPGLAPALERFGLSLPAGFTLTNNLTARGQLDAARRARVIVTDSAGYQELAAVLGVPCLLAAETTARPETVAAGSSSLVGADGAGLATALPDALQRAAAASPYADGLPALLRVLAALREPSVAGPVAAASPASTALPSDGDHTGRTLGDDEVALAAEAIRSGTLNSTRGTFVARFERQFAQWLGCKHAIACNSGSMAVHATIAALRLRAGDEVITTPITDMGALTPILYEGGVPVFADVDPRTLNVTAATIAAQLTERTRAIVVTHLFGRPCDMAAILALAATRALPVIEDAAQAFGATIGPRRAGTFGAMATFSLQQGKHITCGEGGIVATDDDDLARRLFLFVNKAWGYGDSKPDHYFPALNGRLGEVAGAVALAQLPKLDHVVRRRREVAAALAQQLAAVPGLSLPGDPAHGTHSWWKFPFFVDQKQIDGGALALGKRMQAAGVACVPRYIQKPAFECALFQDWQASPVTSLPLQHNPRRDGPQPPFQRAHYPGAVRALDEVVVLPINERYRPADIAFVAAAITTAARELRRG